MKSLYTKEELQEELKAMGLKKGMRVCLQVSPSLAEHIIGGYQSVLSAVMNVVTKKGCVIVPTFDFSNLDPSCQIDIPLEQWETVRNHMPGYHPRLSGCDQLGNQFLKNEGVERSTHPVYSFAYWGTYRLAWLESRSDYPITFETSLVPLNRKDSCNLLLGVKTEDALLLPAIAQVIGLGQIYVQKAKINNPRRSSFKKYLNIRLSKEQKEECLERCKIKEKDWNHQSFKMLSTDIKSDKIKDISSNVSLMELSNR